MPRKATRRNYKVSERSLELNVLSEIINILRRTGYISSYIIGYTTREEAHHGLDVSIGTTGALLIAFQFKAPSSARSNSYSSYRFRIGERCWVCSNPYVRRNTLLNTLLNLGIDPKCINQHTILYVTALVMKRFLNTDVYYTFPLVYRYSELGASVPHVLNRTVFMRVLDFPVDTILSCSTHSVEITVARSSTYPVSINIRSKPHKFPADKAVIGSNIIDVIKTSLESRESKKEHSNEEIVHVPSEELRLLIKKSLLTKIDAEGIEPDRELLQKVEKLSGALANVSFSYRGHGIAINTGKEKETKK